MAAEPLSARLALMVDSAALARRLYPRGGYAGLDSTALQVLIAVAACGQVGCSIGDAADRLGLSTSTASPAAKTLCARQLLSHRNDPRDGRRAILTATRQGKNLVDAFVTDRMADPSIVQLVSADTSHP